MKQEQLEKAKKNRARMFELEHYRGDLEQMHSMIIPFIQNKKVDSPPDRLEKKFDEVFKQCKRELNLIVEEELNLLEKEFEEI